MSSTLNSSMSSIPPWSLPPGPFWPGPVAGIGRPEHVAGLGVALSDALGLAGGQQAEAVVLEHAHRHAHACARRR